MCMQCMDETAQHMFLKCEEYIYIYVYANEREVLFEVVSESACWRKLIE